MAGRHPQGIASALTRLRLAFAQITQTLACNRLRIGRVIEHLNRYPTSIATIVQGAEDRYEIDVSEPRSTTIGVVGVEMASTCSVTVNQLRDRRILCGHCLDIEVQQEIWMPQPIEDLDGLGTGVDEIGLGRRQGLQAQFDAAVADAVLGTAKGIDGVINRLSAAGSGRDAPLRWGAEHQYSAAEIGTAARQCYQIISSPLANSCIGRRQLQPLRFRQQPVQPQERQPVVLGLTAQFAATLGGHFLDGGRQGKRSDLQALISQFGHETTNALVIPTFERFVANSVAHKNKELTPESSRTQRR